jgi:acyl-CoA synthetase (AMP-forming)/AMP-acid ligase II
MPSTFDLEHLVDRTLGDQLRLVAAQRPDQPAILYEDTVYTYGQWDAESDRISQALAGLGIGPGDRVGLWMDKRPEIVTGILGISRARAIAVPINFRLQADKQRIQVQRTGLAAILTQRSHLDEVRGILDLLPRMDRVLVVDGDGDGDGEDGFTPWSVVQAAPAQPLSHLGSPDDVVYLNMTSGTTGNPKAAVTTHRMVQWNARSSIETLGFTADDVFLCMFSVFAHPHELFHRALALGGRLALVDSLNVRAVAKDIEKHRVTWVMAVPSFYEMLSERAVGSGADLSNLRRLEAGGAHLPPEAYARISELLEAPLTPVWGATEVTGVGVAQRTGEAIRPGAMGYPARYYEMRVVRDDGTEAGPDEVGEMWVRGPAVVSTYFDDPVETDLHFVDGWYKTDDLVKRNAAGEFSFCGRRSEMLKVGGIRVFPLEIELVLRSYPAVAEVVVVRHDEQLRGEVPRAVVLARPGYELTARELRDHCRERLALYQVPRYIEIWDEIPRTPAGKVDKKAIVATPLMD